MIQKHFNAISSGAKGMFARQVVLRYRYGQLEICKVPARRPGKGTPSQQAERQRWKDANEYYASAVRMPGVKERYKKGLPRGWNVQNRAVKDFYNAPEIKNVEGGHYTGLAGEVIRITAVDDFMVESVSVAIYDADNQLVEKGKAVHLGGDNWEYTATRDNKGSGRIEIIAKDMPGNEDKMVLAIEGKVEMVATLVQQAVKAPRPQKAFIVKRGKKSVPPRKCQDDKLNE